MPGPSKFEFVEVLQLLVVHIEAEFGKCGCLLHESGESSCETCGAVVRFGNVSKM